MNNRKYIMKTILALIALLLVPAAAQAYPTITETDTATATGLHTLAFTVVNDQASAIELETSVFSYVQNPITPVDDSGGPGGTYCFAHGVCRTVQPGCWAFGQHLRTGGTGFGGTTCGWWRIEAGQTRTITTSVITYYQAKVGWGAYTRLAP